MRRKVLLVAILIIAMLLQCIMPFSMVYATETTGVTITLNSTLYKAVKAQLEKQGITATYIDANGIIVISDSELQKVTKLNLENSSIDDLTGLDAFKYLTDLDLHANLLTEDSNLSVIDSLSLKSLDLSTNQIKSIKSISSFSNIEKADITEQRATEKQVIKVDDSEDTESKVKTVTVNLPDILLEDGNQIKPEWFLNDLNELSREIISYTYTDENGNKITTTPEVDFTNSFKPGSTEVILKVADGDGANYHALRGLIKFEIKVNDSTSPLADTDMVFYYSIVNNEETGIVFTDTNMYKAVKEQLTKGQSVNSELKEDTDGRNIYSRAYDNALILVINDDDVINNIPSLILHDKKIKDITGIEEFVGLESNLDISYNYIASIQKIIELEENKGTKENEMREKFIKVLDFLKAVVAEYDAEIEKIKEYEKKVETVQNEIANYSNDTTQNATQIAQKSNELADLENKIEESRNKAEKKLALIDKYLAKLYKIYEKEYRLVSLLPTNVNYLSLESLENSNLDTVKGYATSIMDKVSSLEQSNSLTTYENWAIRNLMSSWGSSNSLPFKTTKTEHVANPTNGSTTENTVNIENPISEFFDTVKSDETLDLGDYQQFVYIFKCIDALSQIENYTLIKRTFKGKDSNYGSEALDDIVKLYNQKDLPVDIYDLVVYNTKIDGNYLASGKSEAGYEINQTSGIYPVHIGLGLSEYSGSISENNYDINLAHKLSELTNEDVKILITLPRIQILNFADNNTRDLQGIEKLTELKELNAWKNLVNDVSDVAWSNFTKLTSLNLGYNQISDISPLEVIYTLKNLNLSYNLLSGRFSFILANMPDLIYVDFSHNQYSDIGYAKDQFILKALGYDDPNKDTNGDGIVGKDGIAEGYNVSEYLKAAGITLSFQYQTLEMSTTIVKNDDEFVEFELPLIFRQVEDMDNEKTSFGIDSPNGLVEPEGKTVKFKVPDVGTKGQAVVSILGRNGYDKNSYSGIGYGTTCTIKYNVIDEASINPSNPDNPSNPTDPSNPSNPTDPTTPTNPEEIKYGYEVKNGYVTVLKPDTTLKDFENTLVDLNKYTVTVNQNKSSEKIGTGSTVTVTDKSDTSKYVILEVVVKGDINGDGEVDALDSGLIRNQINDTAEALVGVYESAADVNSDGEIDSQDAMYILKYRADRITSFED